ncbi:hypothetical protein CLOP_g20605 [Closterium sp. NIES-67]|nr:hypothetical protein CLOP_g20605 [Closterium sp. NIES-67]
MRLATFATCALNQWAMDFEGNTNRIIASIREAKARGASYRIGPELEITGYGCEDHFLEHDTCQHAWECLAAIITSGATDGILCDIGLPVEHRGVRYNCRAFVHGRRIVLLRPKMDLANDGNYRETRWFATWKRPGAVESARLPPVVTAACEGQREAPIGDGVLDLLDSTLASETCEELFTPLAPHIRLALAGAEVVGNGSGSHHELRKLGTRVSLIQSATSKAGGVYLYANQKGCDGGRLYYDGCAMVVVNGQVVAQGAQFSVVDVEVVIATVDLDQVASYRGAISSLREQASASAPAPSSSFPSSSSSSSSLSVSPPIVRIPSDIPICHPPSTSLTLATSRPIQIHYHCPEEEIALGPACWLWDYLRRSGASGFLLPLSGGADSSSVAAIVGSMCQLVTKAIAGGNEQVQRDAERITGLQLAAGAAEEEQKRHAALLADRILHTIYMGTENSSQATKSRARQLASEIGAWHVDMCIDTVVAAVVALFVTVTGLRPRYKLDGGTSAENLALQNIQARLRMVLAFLFAQLLPWVRGHRGRGVGGPVEKEKEGKVGSRDDQVQRAAEGAEAEGGKGGEDIRGRGGDTRGRGGDTRGRGGDSRGRGGFLLVLGSANVDEALRGYLTKYDCSSADINPIGGISKTDLRRFLRWAAVHLGFPSLADVEAAPPTAELEPIREDYVQLDEVDMGMTYEELSLYGRLRKVVRCGPVAMFQHLCHEWRERLTVAQVAEKVKAFFRFYSMNRHKMTTLTPAYHAENYSPEDNRFDLRQFLYNVRWPWQFQRIDALVEEHEAAAAAAEGAREAGGA